MLFSVGDGGNGMSFGNVDVNIVLSGGGIKGLAFIGAYEELENNFKSIGNIAGVSAGALVGALIAAGYSSRELKSILSDFSFSNFMVTESVLDRYIEQRVLEVNNQKRGGLDDFLLSQDAVPQMRSISRSSNEFQGNRGKFMANLIAYSKKNAFLNGEALEQWVRTLLNQKGINTFSDLRGGIADKVNPRGYKLRMTGVDTNLGKVIVLPDDIVYYNMDPDKLDVAKAVRMSTCVPFVFAPVILTMQDHNHKKKHYIIDGGVLDNFPVWLIDSTQTNPIIGLKLEGKEPKELSTAENILIKLISHSQDTGVPKEAYNIDNIAHINTGDISFLDFDITEEQMQFLYYQGKTAVHSLLSTMKSKNTRKSNSKRRFLR